MNKEVLKDYICAVPFTSIEVQEQQNHLCCASWLLKNLPKKSSVKESWNSKEAKEIRDSVLDGSYRFCDNGTCPFLRQLLHFGPGVGRIKPILHKDSLPDSLKKNIDKHTEDKEFSPQIVQFSFDRTCNLECPSCRIKLITANSKKIKEVEATIKEIEVLYASDIETLYITGSGDPFISVGFRNFLRNFKPEKYPKLKNIHLHTNATKWTPKMWDSMKSIHKYVKTCEISIDAGTKGTYENHTRVGGNWDELLKNLDFIKSIPSLKQVKTSFVVQKCNYREMRIFRDLMKSFFGNRVHVFYGRITNWGTFTNEEFIKRDVSNPNHPEHQDFLNTLNETLPAEHCWSNLQEYIKKVNKVI